MPDLFKQAYRELLAKFRKERLVEQNSAGEYGLYYDLTKKTKEEFSGGTEDGGGNALKKLHKSFG